MLCSTEWLIEKCINRCSMCDDSWWKYEITNCYTCGDAAPVQTRPPLLSQTVRDPPGILQLTKFMYSYKLENH
jgi:hypothetical protein